MARFITGMVRKLLEMVQKCLKLSVLLKNIAIEYRRYQDIKHKCSSPRIISQDFVKYILNINTVFHLFVHIQSNSEDR